MDDKDNPLRDPKTGIIRGILGELYQEEKERTQFRVDPFMWEIVQEQIRSGTYKPPPIFPTS